MEHELKAAADYARCSQIWQRVAPDLDPYPSDSPAPLPAAPSPPACPALQLELQRGAGGRRRRGGERGRGVRRIGIEIGGHALPNLAAAGVIGGGFEFVFHD